MTTSKQRPLSALALGLGLLSTPLAACDAEPVDDDVLEAQSERQALAIEAQLEREHGVELEIVKIDSETGEVELTQVTDLTPPASEGTCGWGHWEYKSTYEGCGSCDIPGAEETSKHTHYDRWCWDGPPSCGGCGGWQYSGWSCLDWCY
jgi:hypothetical protein